MKDLLVYKELEHKGVKIRIEVNYLTKTISFMELDGQTFKNKKWLFAGRTRDYLGGWINILDAMKEATKIGDQLLKTREDEEAEATARLLLAVHDNMEKEAKKTGGKPMKQK